MKVLLVQPYALGPGHYDAYTRKLCTAFCELGVDVTLLTAAGTREGWEHQLPIRHISAMDHRGTFLATLGTPEGSLLIKRARFLWTGSRVERAAFAEFAPGHYDVLHFIDAEPLTLFLHFSSFGKPSNVFVTIPAPYRFPPRHSRLLRYTYDPLRRAAAWQLFKDLKPITHARHVRDSLIELGLVPIFDVPVIPWGIDVPLPTFDKRGARRKLRFSEERTILGFFGYLLPEKGFGFLLNTWPSIVHDCTLLVVAHANSASGEIQAKSRIQALGIGDRLICRFGYVSEEDLAIYTSACDAILLPYKRSFQGESGTLAQACAHQVPLIAADTGAVGEAVRRGGLGIVFEPESTPSLRGAIEKFFQLNEEEVRQCKQNMKLFAASRTWIEVARQHLAVYERQGRQG